MCLINASNDTGAHAQENDNMSAGEAAGFHGPIWWIITGQMLSGFGLAAWRPALVPYIHDLTGGDKRKSALFLCESILNDNKTPLQEDCFKYSFFISSAENSL